MQNKLIEVQKIVFDNLQPNYKYTRHLYTQSYSWLCAYILVYIVQYYHKLLKAYLCVKL